MAPKRFLVARNPDPESSLPYLLSVPIDGGLELKARDRWPSTSRVYCHPLEDAWPEDAEIIEQTPVRLCRRRGPAIDLVLDRPRQFRSQIIFTQIKGRPAIFWQTQKAAKNANPGGRVPHRRVAGLQQLAVRVDTREQYAYRFAGRPVDLTRSALPAGDYAVFDGDTLIASGVHERLVLGCIPGEQIFCHGPKSSNAIAVCHCGHRRHGLPTALKCPQA